MLWMVTQTQNHTLPSRGSRAQLFCCTAPRMKPCECVFHLPILFMSLFHTLIDLSWEPVSSLWQVHTGRGAILGSDRSRLYLDCVQPHHWEPRLHPWGSNTFLSVSLFVFVCICIIVRSKRKSISCADIQSSLKWFIPLTNFEFFNQHLPDHKICTVGIIVEKLNLLSLHLNNRCHIPNLTKKKSLIHKPEKKGCIYKKISKGGAGGVIRIQCH